MVALSVKHDQTDMYLSACINRRDQNFSLWHFYRCVHFHYLKRKYLIQMVVLAQHLSNDKKIIWHLIHMLSK